MLSMIGIGNYAKVILVRRKASGRTYAMKIVKKRKEGKEEGEIKGLKKTHAYIEKEILVTIALSRACARTPSSSNSTPPSSATANSIIFSSIVQAENSSESSAGSNA
jgi:serine/threonine protein kinase